MVDIVTHALIGGVLAAPLLEVAPIPAACLAFGAVLPDLDAFTRLFGKRAFMHAHQTYSHGLPAILSVALLGSPVLGLFGLAEPWAGPALAAGTRAPAKMPHANAHCAVGPRSATTSTAAPRCCQNA